MLRIAITLSVLFCASVAFAADYHPSDDYKKIVAFAHEQGFTVTSTTGDKHNKNSAHYKGKAADVRTKDKTPEQVEQFIKLAKKRGFKVRDERSRPAHQKVWSGPHLHLEVP